MGGWSSATYGSNSTMGNAMAFPQATLSMLADFPSRFANALSPVKSTAQGSGAGSVGAPPGAGSPYAGNTGVSPINAQAANATYQNLAENALDSTFSNVSNKLNALPMGKGFYGLDELGTSSEQGLANLIQLGNMGITVPMTPPSLSPAELAALGPGIAADIPTASGTGSIFTKGPASLPDIYGVGHGSQELPSNEWAETNTPSPWFTPGTQPDTVFPVNEFGQVSGAAVGTATYGNASWGVPATPNAADRPAGATAPAWYNAFAKTAANVNSINRGANDIQVNTNQRFVRSH